MAQYPNRDIERAAIAVTGAVITTVAPASPADDAGFTPGCIITAVDGEPLRDIIDWRWLSADDAIDVSYVDTDGDEGTVSLERDPGQDWGFAFDGAVFDGVRQCCNACTFCFMRQLPRGMRASLALRDDDFRLSFLSGTFVTFTNLTASDEARIVEQRISPLRFSLQAADAQVRRRMIGSHAARGLAAADRLLSAGIRMHAQIVLVPGQNDGAVLDDTLAWAYARSGIVDVGIVPLGFTRHQSVFERSFDAPCDARAVLRQIEPYRQRARKERGHSWVYAADELYCNAYGQQVLEALPPTEDYGDFDMFEDGIGIVRSCADEWAQARASGTLAACACALRRAGMRARIVAGEAMRAYFDTLVESCGTADCIAPLYVTNDFFGGNVTVTGLLCGQDIAAALRAQATPADGIFLPDVVFNDDGLTLDGMCAGDVEQASGREIHVVSCSPLEYLPQIREAAESL